MPDSENIEELVDDRDQGGLSRRDLVRGALVGGAALTLPGLFAGGASASAAGGGPKRGGRLRVAVSGGGSSEALDPHKAVVVADIPRTMAIYERLADPDPTGKVLPSLAESFEPNRTGDVWTVRLKSGITFHNGKPLTADDVIYTIRRNLDKKLALPSLANISIIDPNGIRKIDQRTVRFSLRVPFVFFPEATSIRFLGILPDGFTDFNRPNGTGPFKFQSFTPGERSLFVRNENWWGGRGRPYVDELEVLSISDPGARLNGLIANQIDVIDAPDLAQVKAVARSNQNVKIYSAKSGAWVPITMSITSRPFRDVRVRQAFRLIVDRPQIVRQALLGFGFVGNDLFTPFDPNYGRFPQRHQDIDRAKFLLRQAGQEGLTVTLYSSRSTAGMLESALLFAEQAKKAGVTVKVRNLPVDVYYTPQYYLKVPFAQSQWSGRDLDSQIRQAVNCNSPFNETDWCRRDFDRLTQRAAATIDVERRKALYREAQQMLYNEGGYIIWGFQNFVGAKRANVRGLTPHFAQPLSYYRFQNMWFE